MHLSFVLTIMLASIAHSATLRVKRQLPGCTDTCVVELGTPEWGCDLTDVRCLCLNELFREAMSACVQRSCAGDQVEESLKAIDALCEAATGSQPEMPGPQPEPVPEADPMNSK